MHLANLSLAFPLSLDHLLEDERALQEALYVRSTKYLFFESFLHSSAENFGTVGLQNVVKSINVVEPLPGPAMNDLGEVEERRLSQFQQLLALQIALTSLAGHRGYHRGAMRRKRGTFVGNEFPWMHHFVPARDDADPIGVQVQRPRHADGFRGHRVRMPIVQHCSGGANINRDSKSQIF